MVVRGVEKLLSEKKVVGTSEFFFIILESC